MNPNNSPRVFDPNQSSTRPSKTSRLWQSGATSAMSPSMMSSGGPSPEVPVAFAPAGPSIGIHHSFSTPQMQPRSLDEYPGQSSSRYTSGPSAFRALGNNVGPDSTSIVEDTNFRQLAPSEDNIRLSNISKMTEPSYGSPSRFIGKSPNPRHQPSNRPHRPVDLAFASTEGGSQLTDSMGPKSAPAHVKSFDDCVRDQNLRSWNHDKFDDRWQQGPNEM